MRIAVLGGGSWGTALANTLRGNGHDVLLFLRDPELGAAIAQRAENPRYLPGIPLNTGIRCTTQIETAIDEAELLVSAVPTPAVRGVFSPLRTRLAKNPRIIVTASKGIENENLMTCSQILASVLSEKQHIAVLSGPSFAEETCRKLPTAVVIACASQDVGHFVQELFSAPFLRTYYNSDVKGVELCGALKNVMAIASGIVVGAGLGSNAMAALITRGLTEMTRLGEKLGAQPATFSGLAGMGDLILTCTGDLSRNRQVGVRIGKGESIAQILGSMHKVAEGVKTAKSAFALSQQLGIDMPIVEAVYRVVYEGQPFQEGLRGLMGRKLKDEIR